jgi:23S rRNA pseudouridine955/2504/2580 synthase
MNSGVTNKPPGPGVSHVTIDSESDGQRIDNFLLRHLKGVPKSYVYRILRKGEVRVNKGRVKAVYRLKVGDLVRIPPVRVAEKGDAPSPGRAVLDRLAASIIYEDKGLLVINKPSGVAVHGGSGLSYGVIEAMRELRPQEKGLELIHRLDRDTSGCLMLAKRRSTLRLFHELMRGDGIQKRYLALAAGHFPGKRQRVDAPLRKNTLRGGERVVRVDESGKSALTLFHRVEQFDLGALVEADLKTGRTHQIRVHLAHLGCPILGDDKYGSGEGAGIAERIGLKRLALHAASLRIHLPEESQPLVIEAHLDERLQRAVASMREMT